MSPWAFYIFEIGIEILHFSVMDGGCYIFGPRLLDHPTFLSLRPSPLIYVLRKSKQHVGEKQADQKVETLSLQADVPSIDPLAPIGKIVKERRQIGCARQRRRSKNLPGHRSIIYVSIQESKKQVERLKTNFSASKMCHPLPSAPISQSHRRKFRFHNCENPIHRTRSRDHR